VQLSALHLRHMSANTSVREHLVNTSVSGQLVNTGVHYSSVGDEVTRWRVLFARQLAQAADNVIASEQGEQWIGGVTYHEEGFYGVLCPLLGLWALGPHSDEESSVTGEVQDEYPCAYAMQKRPWGARILLHRWLLCLLTSSRGTVVVGSPVIYPPCCFCSMCDNNNVTMFFFFFWYQRVFLYSQCLVAVCIQACDSQVQMLRYFIVTSCSAIQRHATGALFLVSGTPDAL